MTHLTTCQGFSDTLIHFDEFTSLSCLAGKLFNFLSSLGEKALLAPEQRGLTPDGTCRATDNTPKGRNFHQRLTRRSARGPRGLTGVRLLPHTPVSGGPPHPPRSSAAAPHTSPLPRRGRAGGLRALRRSTTARRPGREREPDLSPSPFRARRAAAGKGTAATRRTAAAAAGAQGEEVTGEEGLPRGGNPRTHEAGGSVRRPPRSAPPGLRLEGLPPPPPPTSSPGRAGYPGPSRAAPARPPRPPLRPAHRPPPGKPSLPPSLPAGGRPYLPGGCRPPRGWRARRAC